MTYESMQSNCSQKVVDRLVDRLVGQIDRLVETLVEQIHFHHAGYISQLMSSQRICDSTERRNPARSLAS
jgi:hypothetical protein